jgi:hypothetical protein
VQSFNPPSFDCNNYFEEPQDEKMNQLVPAKKCQAVMEVTSKWEQLRSFVSGENWAAVESTLDQHPEMAGEVDTTNGEMLLHTICHHPKVWTLLVDTVLVLHPKVLLHKDDIGALPLHHAAAHNNFAALEIIYMRDRQMGPSKPSLSKVCMRNIADVPFARSYVPL